ncbi:pectate lyase superfamily protein-domain-containing protein [Lasiosphaeria hispida]|uniref:Pectate lyase superfamily protein-domain-containing protein n=1 Tax=Lasiosphaeria hispida TaxID=260671 RepID=A0AAJ0HRM7_9PEZI|nr:pectate lyase superfamily protein-domain-containing protein [Lasiosphaeria hispida]
MRPLFLVAAASWTTATLHAGPHELHHPRQSCTGPTAGSPPTWWRAEMEHDGTAPSSTDPTYQYHRTVVQYGADNTGVNDSSPAFNLAITAWNRTANTATTRPAYIAIPPGTYLLHSPIQLLVSTFLVGDALHPPTLLADAALGTQPVLRGFDAHQGAGSATKNFYMAVRNVRVDTTRIARETEARAVEWSVAQGCSFVNVHVVMPAPSRHTGLGMGFGGSGVLIADCTFTGGAVGLSLSSQQYLLKGLAFDGCETGVFFQESFVTTIQGATFANCRYGVDVGRSGSAGSVSIVDSSVSKCEAGVLAYVSGSGQNSLVLDGFDVSEAVAVKSSTGATLLEGSVPVGQTWVMGNAAPYNYQSGTMYPIERPASLLSDGKYFTAPLPQYEEYDISQFISVKGDPDFKVYGDNTHDDGPAINALLRKHAGCKIIFFPQGIYQTRETIHAPPGSRIVGEALSVITGTGPAFADASNPRPILQLGSPGDQGVAQLSDVLVSAGDVLPGAILIQVNTAGRAAGDVGLWNVAMRVGGSHDTAVSAKCTSLDPAGCKAAFALLHLTKTSSAYLEGVWGWVADHGLDPSLDPATAAQTIAVGRGALVESAGPTWLVGTSFEHCVLYQYALRGAEDVYMALQQTESPYWQGAGTPHRAPAPWTPSAAHGDPTFGNCAAQGLADDDRCYRAWAQYVSNSSGVVIHGSALWVFFNKMNDNMWRDPQCESTGGVCQVNMAAVDGAKGMFWYSLSAKSATNLVYDTTGGESLVVAQKDNVGSWGGALAAYLERTGRDGVKGEDGGDGHDSSMGRALFPSWGLALALAASVFYVLGVLM